MKLPFLIFFMFTTSFLYSQNSAKLDSSIAFLDKQGIHLNTVIPPSGFKIHYNCDSLLFMRGDFGDTIKIWTSAMDWYQNLEQFKDIMNNTNFGETQFAKSIDGDGRIYVSTYHQTEFIFRNDSLFEIGNSNPTPSEPLTTLFSEYFNQRIDKATYETRLDSLQRIEEKQAVYTPKLIFTKKMFQKNKKKVKLPKRLNFEEDTIVLENQWVQNGKTCYFVRINNKGEDGEKTSYGYAIDQDMRFVYWEGCLNN